MYLPVPSLGPSASTIVARKRLLQVQPGRSLVRARAPETRAEVTPPSFSRYLTGPHPRITRGSDGNEISFPPACREGYLPRRELQIQDRATTTAAAPGAVWGPRSVLVMEIAISRLVVNLSFLSTASSRSERRPRERPRRGHQSQKHRRYNDTPNIHHERQSLKRGLLRFHRRYLRPHRDDLGDHKVVLSQRFLF